MTVGENMGFALKVARVDKHSIQERVNEAARMLELQPYLADQELPLTITYWEGAVRVSGTAGGNGYVELTGYAATGNGDMPR